MIIFIIEGRKAFMAETRNLVVAGYVEESRKLHDGWRDRAHFGGSRSCAGVIILSAPKSTLIGSTGGWRRYVPILQHRQLIGISRRWKNLTDSSGVTFIVNKCECLSLWLPRAEIIKYAAG